ncbi:ROK family protein [Nitrosomonas supralitoralis]|uniref:ROK family protein n=1 Tax=Nitrosomonas supralitoralis TaxID=2116706 RepID=UPI000E714A84|nr:ROK family protein [Nitrosomonas supralitoralis]
MNTQTSHNILVIDVGGTNIKLLMTGHHKPLKIPSGPTMSPKKMVKQIKDATSDWNYDCVSIGYPGLVIGGCPVHEPFNLGTGWVSFNFQKSFGCPVKLINDAAMQALGSYCQGRMLFLGLGTGLGSALIVDGILEPMELAHLPYKHGKTYEDYLGRRGLEKRGKKKWRRYVFEVSNKLKTALEADYVVLGGGNAKKLKKLPEGLRMGDNDNAFLGGFRLWDTTAMDKSCNLVLNTMSRSLTCSYLTLPKHKTAHEFVRQRLSKIQSVQEKIHD